LASKGAFFVKGKKLSSKKVTIVVNVDEYANESEKKKYFLYYSDVISLSKYELEFLDVKLPHEIEIKLLMASEPKMQVSEIVSNLVVFARTVAVVDT